MKLRSETRSRFLRTFFISKIMEYPHSKITKLYRCEIDMIITDEIDFSAEQVVVYLEYDVIRHTPKGFVIKVYDHHKSLQQNDFRFASQYKFKEKFVLRGQGKRLAHETKQMASESFFKRSKRRIFILERQLEIAKQVVKIAYEHLYPSYGQGTTVL